MSTRTQNTFVTKSIAKMRQLLGGLALAALFALANTAQADVVWTYDFQWSNPLPVTGLTQDVKDFQTRAGGADKTNDIGDAYNTGNINGKNRWLLFSATRGESVSSSAPGGRDNPLVIQDVAAGSNFHDVGGANATGAAAVIHNQGGGLVLKNSHLQYITPFATSPQDVSINNIAGGSLTLINSTIGNLNLSEKAEITPYPLARSNDSQDLYFDNAVITGISNTWFGDTHLTLGAGGVSIATVLTNGSSNQISNFGNVDIFVDVTDALLDKYSSSIVDGALTIDLVGALGSDALIRGNFVDDYKSIYVTLGEETALWRESQGITAFDDNWLIDSLVNYNLDNWEILGTGLGDWQIRLYLGNGDAGNEGDASTPEPATMLIFGLGLAGLALARRRRK
jgi:hypothetical protein